MNENNFAILGVGNILEMDDGVAVYATRYLQSNYTFTPSIEIINGGVEGINLLNVFMQYKHILILDTIDIEDSPGSIYHIPAEELTGYGLNSGGAHEIGVIQCLDMLELMGRELPRSSILGIIPDEIDICIGLSTVLHERFDDYIKSVLGILEKNGIIVTQKEPITPLKSIIENFS